MFKMEYPLKFKAAILERNNQPLVVDEVEFGGPLGVGQVLVKLQCQYIVRRAEQ